VQNAGWQTGLLEEPCNQMTAGHRRLDIWLEHDCVTSTSAGRMARAARMKGEFHGVMTPTTPIGTRCAKLRLSPVVLRRWPTAPGKRCDLQRLADREPDSKSPFGGMEPLSRTIQREISAECISTSWANLRNTSAREVAGLRAHAACASRAAAALAATSAALARPDSNIGSPDALSVTVTAPPFGVSNSRRKRASRVGPTTGGPLSSNS